MLNKHLVLDPKIPTRSVDFVEALHVLTLSNENPTTYTDLFNLALSKRIIVNRKGELLKKSSFHRNWKTLEVLSLIRKDGNIYRPTKIGEALLDTFQSEGSEPGERTKHLLRQAMIESEIVRHNFLSLFASNQSNKPLQDTAAVALLPSRGEKNAPRRERVYRIQNLATGCVYELSYRQVIGILWGLGGWAMRLGLLDQLYARPQDGVEPDQSKIVFLVNPDRPFESISKSFIAKIEKLIQQSAPTYGNTVRIPISWLFYKLCPDVQLSALSARAQLISWLKQNERRSFVEGASQPVVRNIRRRNPNGTRISWELQEPALLEMNGRHYTYLFCRKQSGTNRGRTQ